MEYNYRLIGKRIAAERNRLGMSQAKLIDALSSKISIGRNSLSAIENGNIEYCSLKLLTELCVLFDCEMGYLLGAFDCRTRENTDVCAATGLEEIAVNELKERKFDAPFKNYEVNILSQLIVMREFWQVIREIRLMLDADSRCTSETHSTMSGLNGQITLSGKQVGDYFRNNAVNMFHDVVRQIREG